MKLTEAELAALDDKDREAWRRTQKATAGPWKSGLFGVYECIAHQVDGSWNNDLLCGPNKGIDAMFIACARTDVPRLIQKLARTLSPLPCGHPGACQKEAQPDDVICGGPACAWCEDIGRINDEGSIMSVDWHYAMEKVEAECDALREKLKKATDNAVYWMDQAKVLNAKLTLAREKLKAAEQEAGCLRLNQTAYDLGMKEIVRDQDRLRARFKAAEGLAEAIGHNVTLYRRASTVSSDNPLRPTRVEWEAATELVEQALAAWKEADDRDT